MITFPRLGEVGRLGNQLFQIAGTWCIAQDLMEGCSFPKWDYMDYFNVDPTLFTGRNGKDAAEIPSHLDVRTRRFLQDIALWEDHEEEVWEMFQPSQIARDYLYEHYGEFYDLYKNGQGIISLHVRRGDNAARANGDDYYPLPTMDYYRRALDHLGDGQVVVFSDDAEWCEEHIVREIGREALIIGSQTRPETVPGKTNPVAAMDWTDMVLMTMCNKHIIANSTYSWWGAWLSVHKNVVYPSVWYGPKIAEYADWRLIIPDDWTEVPV